jgi:HSP20 family protein
MLDADRALRNFHWQFANSPRLRPESRSQFDPSLQAAENENEFVVSAELPGYEPEDVEVFVEDGVLTVKGTRKHPEWSDELSDEEKAKKTYRFERRIRFNGEIDEENVSAHCKNGLLTVNVPKPVVPQPEVRAIPIQVN